MHVKGNIKIESGSLIGANDLVLMMQRGYNTLFVDPGFNEKMRITSDGNVGIGTVSPSEKLEVAGNIKASGICIGSDCRTSWPSGSEQTGIIPGTYSVIDTEGTTYNYKQYGPADTLKIVFARPLDPALSYGRSMSVFDKEYFLGSGTTDLNNQIVTLYGGGTEVGFDWTGTSITRRVTVGNNTVSITLNGITNNNADLTIDGVSYIQSQGSYITTASGIRIYVRSAVLYGQGFVGRVVLRIGVDKIKLQNGQTIKVGSTDDPVQGTVVTISSSGGGISQIEIRVYPHQGILNFIGAE